jgi:hypothetical protein
VETTGTGPLRRHSDEICTLAPMPKSAAPSGDLHLTPTDWRDAARPPSLVAASADGAG